MAEHDLEGLLEEIGIRLGRSTDHEVYGYCPWHKRNLGRPDGRPGTWSVSRVSGNNFCFACGGGGTLQDLIVDQRGGTVWGALGLMRDYGIDPSAIDSLPDSYYDRGRRTRAPEHMPETALDGFVDPPLSALRKRHLTPSSAKEYGVRWDAQERCWITPIRLVGGALIGWQAKNKRFFRNHPEKVPKSKTLFGVDRLEPGTTAILVESPLDVLRIYAAGFLGAVSSYGVYVTDDQMRLLLSVTEEVIIALDNDDNGRKETRHLIDGSPRTPKGKQGVPWPQKFADFRVYDYAESTAKDPGDQTDEEIEHGVEHAIPAHEWSTA